MNSKTALRASPGVAKLCSVDQFALERGKETLTQSVIVTVPYGSPIEGLTPALRQRSPKAMEVYWQPWSEW